MPDLVSIIQTGGASPWVYLPIAVALGALHALEPGHSKSLMAAFIVAVRGTVPQAMLLGLSAAVGHTIIVWGIAFLGLYLGDKLILDRAEPWLVLISGILIILLAFRLIWVMYRKANPLKETHHHGYGGHYHQDHAGHSHHNDDDHAKAHGRDLEEKFVGRNDITKWEIVWFGFTGGLLPCPAAIAVLIVCLQLKAFTLGIAMVAAFSVGLAITLVTIGVVAAWGVRHARKAWSGFDFWSARLPYVSGAIVMTLGAVITIRGAIEIMAA